MGFKELSIDCRNKKIPAKTQRRKEDPRCVQSRVMIHLASACQLQSVVHAVRDHPCSLFFASLRLCGELLLVISLAATATAQTRHGMAPADILRVANVGDAQISPSGDWVVTPSPLSKAMTRARLCGSLTRPRAKPAARMPRPARTDCDRCGNTGAAAGVRLERYQSALVSRRQEHRVFRRS